MAVRKDVSVVLHLLASAGLTTAVGLLNLTLVPLNAAFGGNSLGLSFLDGSFAVGALMCGALMARFDEWLDSSRGVIFLLACQALVFIALIVAPHIAVAAAVMLFCGVVNTAATLVFNTTLQLRCDQFTLGRMSSLQDFVASITVTPIVLFSGFALGHWGLDSVLAAGGLTVVCCLAALVLSSALRRRSVLSLLTAPFGIEPSSTSFGHSSRSSS